MCIRDSSELLKAGAKYELPAAAAITYLKKKYKKGLCQKRFVKSQQRQCPFLPDNNINSDHTRFPIQLKIGNIIIGINIAGV